MDSLDLDIERLQAAMAADGEKADHPILTAGSADEHPAADPALILIPSYEVTRGQTKISCQPVQEAPGFDWPRPSAPQTCEERLGVAFCGKTVRKYRQGCSRGDCWGCEDHLRTRQAAKFKGESITPHLAGRDLCYTVLTTPEHLRQAAAHYPTWAKWVKTFLKALEARLGMAWGVLRSDPAGKCKEAERLGRYCDCSKCSKWHPHVNLLWVRKGGSGELSDYELWLMKSLWAEAIGAAHVWDGNRPRPMVVVHHYYKADPSTLKGKEKERAEGCLWKWYSYQGRKWPAWQKTAKKFLRIRWVGKYPAKAITESKAEAKLRLLYQELYQAQEERQDKTAAKIQRKIDKLRTAAPCRCGCGVIRRPEPDPVCECCGEQVRCMPVMDDEEADHWVKEGPEAVRAEIRRRRRDGDKNGREPFEKFDVALWNRSAAAAPSPELFERAGGVG